MLSSGPPNKLAKLVTVLSRGERVNTIVLHEDQALWLLKDLEPMKEQDKVAATLALAVMHRVPTNRDPEFKLIRLSQNEVTWLRDYARKQMTRFRDKYAQGDRFYSLQQHATWVGLAVGIRIGVGSPDKDGYYPIYETKAPPRGEADF